MSNNNGTGFWVVVALIAAMSVAVLIEAVMRVASGLLARGLRRLRTTVTLFSRNDRIIGERA